MSIDEIRGTLSELSSINTEITRLSQHVKDLRDKKKDLDERVITFLKDNNRSGIRYGENIYILSEMKRTKLKPKKVREEDFYNLLKDCGVPDPDEVSFRMKTISKGEEVVVPVLRKKKSDGF